MNAKTSLIISLILSVACIAPAAAKEKKSFNVYIVGEGRNRLAAMRDLVKKTEAKEKGLVDLCTSSGGQAEWGDVEYPEEINYVDLIRARQSFNCKTTTAAKPAIPAKPQIESETIQ